MYMYTSKQCTHVTYHTSKVYVYSGSGCVTRVAGYQSNSWEQRKVGGRGETVKGHR